MLVALMAGEDIERLRQAALRDPAQLVRFADQLVAAGRSDEAIAACRKGLETRPEDIPLRLALGRALSAAGHLEEAQAALLDAVARQKKPPGAAPPVEPTAAPSVPPTRAYGSPALGRLPPAHPPTSRPPMSAPPTAYPAQQDRSDPTELDVRANDHEWPDAPTIQTSGRARSHAPLPHLTAPMEDSNPIEAADGLDDESPTGIMGADEVATLARRTLPPQAVEDFGRPTSSRSPTQERFDPGTPESYEVDITDERETQRAPPQSGGRAQPRPTARSTPQPERRAAQAEGAQAEPERAPSPRAARAPAASNGVIDLDEAARILLGDGGLSDDDSAAWQTEDVIPEPPVDQMAIQWDARRARSFVWLWAALVLLAGGIAGGYIYRARERARLLALTVERADARAVEATDEAEVAARDAYAGALRAEPRARKYFAMVALAAARLAADHGEDTDAAAWAMMKRAEREGVRHPDEPDPRADKELRQARGLLALERGEPCPAMQEKADGDIAARCALQRGDVDGARRILNEAIKAQDGKSARALLALGSLELGAGDLDAANDAFGKVLTLHPEHPRATVGRLLVAIERGESPTIQIPQKRLGPTNSAWYHLATGLAAIGHRGEVDEALVQAELDAARRGIVHDGRLALLYGRARLLQGRVAEAEQAMRIAERLNPNDGDVAVLDAEVALAKGYEEKVVMALSNGPPSPRKLAVLGRAQCLTGKYKEAAATLDAALARRPGDAISITYRAIARAHLGDQAGAVRELEKAASTLASTAPHYGLGLLAFERRDLQRARSELGKALQQNSESFRARALLGRVLRDLGKPVEALAELERVAREAPALVPVHAALGRLLLDLGRDREARSELRQVLDGGKPSPEDRLAYAEATINLGLAQEGERALNDAVEAGIPASRTARLHLALQSWKGPKEAAIAAKALEKERRGPAMYEAKLAILTASAWRRAGDLRKAGDDFRAAMLADPLHANLGIGRLQAAQNDNAGAEASYRAALAAWEHGPYGVDDFTEARIGLGRVLLARKAISEAVSTLEPTIEKDPMAAEAHYWLARAYQEANDQDKARGQAEKACELDDRFAEAFALVGDLSKAARKDRARIAYKKYLELSPDGAQARSIKKALAALK
jgi:predicted Zn-dependent protease